jgi:hypothetical protein
MAVSLFDQHEILMSKGNIVDTAIHNNDEYDQLRYHINVSLHRRTRVSFETSNLTAFAAEEADMELLIVALASQLEVAKVRKFFIYH